MVALSERRAKPMREDLRCRIRGVSAIVVGVYSGSIRFMHKFDKRLKSLQSGQSWFEAVPYSV